MLLAYLDESHTSDYYYIAALVVPEREARPFAEALDEVVGKAAQAYPGIDRDTELHGHELFHGTKGWKPLAGMVRARIGIYNDAFKAIADHHLAIILRGMNVRAQRARYVAPDPPHGVVLAHLLEEVDRHAERCQELALVIADEVDGQSGYRRDLRHFQRYSTWGYKARRLARIVDTMHFVPSHASRLVQAADLVAFLHRRRSTLVESDDRARKANEALWNRIEAKVVHSWTWCP